MVVVCVVHRKPRAINNLASSVASGAYSQKMVQRSCACFMSPVEARVLSVSQLSTIFEATPTPRAHFRGKYI